MSTCPTIKTNPAPSPETASGTRAALTIALDLPHSQQALAFADTLSSLPVWLKLGLELFTAEGPALVRALRDRNLPIFLDLKFHDIPNTIKGAVRSASLLGVDMLTLHTCGGEAMCLAAVEGRNEAVAARQQSGPASADNASATESPGARRPLLMGVSVLTSQDGDPGELSELVVARSLLAKRCGLDGVVCSGHEAAAVKKACGSEFLCLCPGIRFAGAGRDDQARVCTPSEAVAAGADFLVMGRPVTTAADPKNAALRALAEMASAFTDMGIKK